MMEILVLKAARGVVNDSLEIAARDVARSCRSLDARRISLQIFRTLRLSLSVCLSLSFSRVHDTNGSYNFP